MDQNHEETIMRAYVWSLYSNGETVEKAKRLAAQNINLFKRAEVVEIREKERHNDPVTVEHLAEYIAGKYLTSLTSFTKEAEGKKNLHDLEAWWQKHQLRASMNLAKAGFNEFAMKIMPSLRSKLESKEVALKAQAVRKPEKLEEWKQQVDAVDNIPHLDNWYRKHWGEVEESLPHEEDQAELLKYCGEIKQKLKEEYAKSINNPPPESPPQGYKEAHQVYGELERREGPEPPVTKHQENEGDAEQEEPEEFKLQLEFSLFCSKKQVKEIANDVYTLVGNSPLLKGEITLRRL